MRQLDWDPEVDVSAVGVAAKNGTATLSGFIDTYSGRWTNGTRSAERMHAGRAVAMTTRAVQISFRNMSVSPPSRIVINHELTLDATARSTSHKSDELDGRHKDALVSLHEAFDVARRRLEDVARRQRGDVKTRAAVT